MMITIGIIFAVLLAVSFTTTRRGHDFNPGCVLVSDCLAIRPGPEVDLNNLTYGFLGFIGKAIGAVAGVVGSVAKVIPGVGSAISAGAAAVSAVLGGGTASAKTKGGTTTVIGTVPAGQVAGTGFFDKKGWLGIPVFVYVIAGLGISYIFLKRKKII